MSFELRTPPLNPPYRYGLLDSLGFSPLSGRTLEGAIWERLSCDLPLPFDTSVCPSIAITKPSPATSRGESDPIFPFGLYSAWTCASVGNSQEDANREARRILDDGREWFVATEFASQLATNPDIVDLGGPVTASCALAQAQGYVQGLDGRRSTIFAPPQVVSVWSETQALVFGDNTITTKLGNKVILIPAQGPGTVFPVYFTDSDPILYLSEPDVLSDDSASRLRADNSFIGVIEQLALIQFDFCQAAKILVDVCL